ncbi:probable ATP-dependent RNA helicase DDX20 isoform X2 [Agrilus planipennis]|uniref:Probable ATP-dependent RNA helicase DDX20 isoform X2 n=1 Tax=Agrilus planipennis TaxID=224129 RepID=A0A1W4WE29_AGRPL|nr:probable ATP-dependent RNA helicase DDX20 isoform X2 [Agrilus planipennis]
MDTEVEEIFKNENENPLKFDNIFLTKSLLNALKDSSFQKLSPLQHTSLPLGISGFDLIIKDHPGKGRFVLYAILALELIKIGSNHAQVLILACKEEIRMIKEVMINLGQYLEGLKVSTYDEETQDYENIFDCHIAIASTNKIRSFIDSGTLPTDNISLIILDNSDKLMNFDYILFEELFKLLPSKKQIISLASVYSVDLEEFLKKYMNHPLEISHEIESSVLLGFSHFVCTINQPQDNAGSITEAKTMQLCSILSKISFTRCIIYTNNESRGVYISKTLQDKGWNSFYAPFFINDSEITKKIKKSKCLISTTCLDMRKFQCDVNLIINYDIPMCSAAYIERIGKVVNKTKGIYINMILPGEELDRFEQILGDIGGPEMSVPIIDINDSFFEDIWNVETNSLDHICGITNMGSQPKTDQKLKKLVSDIIKYRLEQCEEDSVASKLKNLSVAHKSHINITNDNAKSLELKNYLEELASGKDSAKPSNENNSTSTNDDQNTLGNMKQQDDALHISNKNDDDILIRNVALLNVAKLITNSDNLQEEKISKDITQPLNGYLNYLKKTEVSSISIESDSEVSVSNEQNYANSHKKEEDNNFHLKDIFKIGYDFLIKPISSLKTTGESRNGLETQPSKCKELMSEVVDNKPDQFDQFNDLNLQLVNENKIPAKADKRKTRSQKNKNRNSKRSKFCEEYADNENNDVQRELTACKEESLTIQESVEVNEEIYTLSDTRNSINQVAESYFDYYSNILWNDGLTFDDVSSFDNWFAQWQAQVHCVREYVQQRIYLDEMNALQQNQ